MATKVGRKALTHNPALKPFEVLTGEWQTTGLHPYLPDTVLHGRSTFEWHEGGAFLIMHSEIDHPKFPDGVEIFGSDDETKEYFILHFDERGVSRKYDVAIIGNELKWWRKDPEFSQRFTMSMEKDRLVSKGEMSQDGVAWNDDLALTYIRIANGL